MRKMAVTVIKPFRPGKQITDLIDTDTYRSARYRTLPKLHKGELGPVIRSICVKINDFYAGAHNLWNTDPMQPRIDTGSGYIVIKSGDVLRLTLEALDNGMVHGTKRKQYCNLGLFFGKKGLCFGFQDPGYYYKQKEVKAALESKTSQIIKSDSNALSHGYGIRRHIYHYSDHISVDTRTGVLYCVQMLDRLRLDDWEVDDLSKNVTEPE
jgi:hypothetical protein